MNRDRKWGRRRRRPFRAVGLLLIFAVSAFIAYRIFMPDYSHVDPPWKNMAKPIFFASEAAAYSASGTGETLCLPLPVIQARIDESALYEPDSGSVILAAADRLVRLKLNSPTATINNAQQTLQTAPTQKDGIVYVPASLVEEVYGVQIKEDQASGAVRVFLPGESIQNAAVKADKRGRTSPLRESDTIHSPILTDVKPGTHLRILNKKGKWYYAQTDSGYAGFIRDKLVDAEEKTFVPDQEPKVIPGVQAWQGKKINLTWEAVYQVPPKPSSIGKLPGINVVSPTWFQLADTQGTVKSKADNTYVEWAHNQGMQVWGLYSNSYNPDLTTKALATFDLRIKEINQLLDYAAQYHLDGINIDFENVYTKDKDHVTQFVRELRPLARAHNLVVSIDVTPKSDSELWSKFLDRKALGGIVDYMALMAYDEHWAASPVAGSVASLPWTESAVSTIMTEDQVPPAKIILGVPLYTRVWSEETVNGKTKVSSKAIGMSKAQSILKQFSLKPLVSADTGQNYVEYTEDGLVKKIWLEDSESLQRRVDVVKRFNLGGIASWNRSFASEDAWDVLKLVNE